MNILKAADSPPKSTGLTNIGGDFDSIASKGFVAFISIPGTINNSYVYLLRRRLVKCCCVYKISLWLLTFSQHFPPPPSNKPHKFHFSLAILSIVSVSAMVAQ